MDVQSAVVSALTTEGAAAQETTRLIQSQISLLRERRQALITASVTGELEISEMAA
jgi:type I restriction enzyme S subunit